MSNDFKGGIIIKVIMNINYGGFILSDKALFILGKLGMTKDVIDNMSSFEVMTNKKIIQVIEELGIEANGLSTKIEIIDVPRDGIKVLIEKYGNMKYKDEEHCIWV